MTWDDAPEPEMPRPGLVAPLIAVVRIVLIVLVTIVLTIPYLLLKGFGVGARERLVGIWARAVLTCLGVRLTTVGTPRAAGAVVANHVSWMDILTMRAAAPVTFVSKAEVRGWPAIGMLAAMVGTMFIERKATEAKRQQIEMKRRVDDGALLCFFPEGTSTDGRRVLPFKSSLFAVFMSEDLRETVEVQPVTLAYLPRQGLPEAFFGWWGDMGLLSSMWQVLTLAAGSRVEVRFAEPIPARDVDHRKTLAQRSFVAVAGGLVDAGIRVPEAG